MSKLKKLEENNQGSLGKALQSPMQRRAFFRYAGGTAAAAALLLTACNDDDFFPMPPLEGVDLGSGDIGILNYAYALEQLEAAFYTEVVKKSGSALSSDEMKVMKDIKAHEVAHREFFKAALGGKAIADLEVDFSKINFSDKDSVLTTAQTFEDLGVAAYNGAGKLFSDSGNGLTYLLLAGKIVSVEARHAAAIHDLISGNNRKFGEELIDRNGLDRAFMPEKVLQAAGPYIKTKINFSNLPTK
ncbi:ferritin-like domain-containing protein [Pontibacter liquoris]|uniref:ferritin-like domain-containing protein n=1 Tax=Pontibacter liquoris TaxID=2905677 RepID=UPI001FA6DBEB|nr:ferritin-like domain-containing protein [Pontibacter liquoris]